MKNKILLKDRRGSHVGVIASFTIFILFLVGIYLATQPLLKTEKDREVLLESLWVETTNLLSNEMTTVVINSSGTANCTRVNYSLVGQLGEIGIGIAKDINGVQLKTGYSSQSLDINLTGTIENILWAYYSKEFSPPGTVCSGAVEWAQIKSIRNGNYVFEKRVLSAINNFESFKGNLSIPQENKMEMEFTLANGTPVKTTISEIDRDVFVKERKVQYVNGNATILYGKLKIILF